VNPQEAKRGRPVNLFDQDGEDACASRKMMARDIHTVNAGNRRVLEVLPGLMDVTEKKQKNAVC
jgi:hypothetical protein